MLSLEAAIQTLFTLLSLATDYTLLFDLWMLSTPTPLICRAEKPTKSQVWRANARSCLVYAVLEPLAYMAMTKMSNVAMWWFLMMHFLHFTIGVQGLFVLANDGMKRLRNACEERCEKTEERERYRDVDRREDEEEKISVPATPVETSPRAPKSCPTDTHNALPFPYRMASILPILTTAFSNSSLLFYTRFLSTSASHGWLGRFSFGWRTVALMCICVFFIAKGHNWYLFKSHGGLPKTWVAAGKRLCTLVGLLVTRSVVRAAIGQEPFSCGFHDNDVGGWTLTGGRDIADDDNIIDKWMKKLPWWTGGAAAAFNVCVCVISVGHAVYKKRGARNRKNGDG